MDDFDTQFGLAGSGPDLYDQYGPASSFLTVLNQDGQATALPSTDPSGPGTTNWEVEEALDVEWAHAIAPGAQIVLVEADSQSLSDLMAAVATAAAQPGVSVVSMSWGFPEGQSVSAADEAQYDPTFDVPGVTFLASTGDYGAADPEYPAFSPDVVAVGGTTLTLNADNSHNSETGWGDVSGDSGSSISSGGGISLYETEPSYQAAVQSTGYRTTPDVSLVADPDTGAWIADPYNLDPSNPFEVVGGTSLSAPAWAGLIALVDQGRVAAGESALNSSGPGEAQQALYSLPQSDYNVIGSGNNGYSAGSGYNLVTGLGTPIANRLVPDLVAYAGPGTSYPGPKVGPLQDATLEYAGNAGGGTIDVFSIFAAIPARHGARRRRRSSGIRPRRLPPTTTTGDRQHARPRRCRHPPAPPGLAAAAARAGTLSARRRRLPHRHRRMPATRGADRRDGGPAVAVARAEATRSAVLRVLGEADGRSRSLIARPSAGGPHDRLLDDLIADPAVGPTSRGRRGPPAPRRPHRSAVSAAAERGEPVAVGADRARGSSPGRPPTHQAASRPAAARTPGHCRPPAGRRLLRRHRACRPADCLARGDRRRRAPGHARSARRWSSLDPAGAADPCRCEYRSVSTARGEIHMSIFVLGPRTMARDGEPVIALIYDDDAYVESAGLLGRRVAGRTFLEAYLAHGRFDELATLIRKRSSTATMIETWRNRPADGGPERSLRIVEQCSFHKVFLRDPPATVIHAPQPPDWKLAWARQQAGTHAFSLTGVTHTLCSIDCVTMLREMVTSPYEPYDAMICTSRAGEVDMVRRVTGSGMPSTSDRGSAARAAPGAVDDPAGD